MRGLGLALLLGVAFVAGGERGGSPYGQLMRLWMDEGGVLGEPLLIHAHRRSFFVVLLLTMCVFTQILYSPTRMGAQHPSDSGTFSQLDLRQAYKPIDVIPRTSVTWEAGVSARKSC